MITAKPLAWTWKRQDDGSWLGTLERKWVAFAGHIVFSGSAIDVFVSAVYFDGVHHPDPANEELRRSFRLGSLTHQALKDTVERLATEMGQAHLRSRAFKQAPATSASATNFAVLVKQEREQRQGLLAPLFRIPEFTLSQFRTLRAVPDAGFLRCAARAFGRAILLWLAHRK